MKRKMLGIAIAIIMLLGVFGMAGCGNSHGIPNGKYVSTDGSAKKSTLLRAGVSDYDYYWRIKGNKVTWYASGWLTYQGKIMQGDGGVHFEIYPINGRFGGKSGDAFMCEVLYDEVTKKLVVLFP